MKTTMEDLRAALKGLQAHTAYPLTLDGAYGGWRVEAEGCRDALGTGYVTKGTLYTAMRAALNFASIARVSA